MSKSACPKGPNRIFCEPCQNGSFNPLYRTHGLVSSAEALGVTRDADEDNKTTDQTEPSPTLDRAALYRLARHWRSRIHGFISG